MFKPFFFTALLATSFAAVAKSEKDDFIAQRKDSIIGYTTNKAPLQAVCYSFPTNVYRIGIDNEQNNAVLLLRKVDEDNKFHGDGELSLLNFEAGNFDWHFTVKGTEVHRTRNVIFYQSKAGTFIFNVTDKKRLPATISNYCFLDYNNDVAYDGVSAVDLKSGKRVWKHSIRNQDFPLDDLCRINDSMVAFSWAGMHVLNMNTGEGWDYKMKTTKGMALSVFTSIGVGVASGLLTPVVVVPVARPQTGVKSNILFDSENIYFADKENIVCWKINTGDVVWKNDLSSKMASSSELFLNGGNVYLVNKGRIGTKDAGTPFIAGYNGKTGAPLFFEELGETGISSLIVQNDTCLVYNGNFCKIDLRTGKHTSQPFSANRPVTPGRWFVDAEKIFMEDGKKALQPISRIFPRCFFMQTENGEISVFNDRAELQQILTPGSYWFTDRSYKNCKVLQNGKQEIAFERDGQKLFSLQGAFMTEIVGDKLYRIVDKGLQVISLPELTTN